MSICDNAKKLANYFCIGYGIVELGRIDNKDGRQKEMTVAQKQNIPEDQLPWTVRNSYFGISLALLGLSAGGLVMQVIDAFVPIAGKGIPGWLWPVFIIIWAPGIVGVCLGYYAVIRYPYLSLAIEWTPTLTSNRWLWILLGLVFWAIALLCSLVSVLAVFSSPFDIWNVLSSGYFAIECWFLGFLLLRFRADRHPTVATFITVTLGIGILLLPAYLPALVIGNIRCRKFLATFDTA